jgi:hypothetical protein
MRSANHLTDIYQGAFAKEIMKTKEEKTEKGRRWLWLVSFGCQTLCCECSSPAGISVENR